MSTKNRTANLTPEEALGAEGLQPIGPALESLRKSREEAEARLVAAASETPTAKKSGRDADEFDDLDSLCVNQDFAAKPLTKKLLLHVPVGRPNDQTFFRVHPAPGFRRDFHTIVDKSDNELYLVRKDFAPQLQGIVKVTAKTMFTYITRDGRIGLFPVPLIGPDDKDLAWYSTAREIAVRAIEHWLCMSPNMNDGCYEARQAEVDFGEPSWPEEDYTTIMRVAFKGKTTIGDFDHDVMKKLLGRV